MPYTSTTPCIDMVSDAEQASKHEVESPYAAAQIADFGNLEKSERNADSWRRVASVEAIAIVGMVGLCAMLGSRPLQPPVVYHESANGLIQQRIEPLQSLAPDKVAKTSAIINYVKAYRDVGPSMQTDEADYDLVYYMTIDKQPYNEKTTVQASFSDPANNPKILGANGMVRVVSNIIPLLRPVSPTAEPIEIEEWEVTWHEDLTTKPGQPSIPSEHHGLIFTKANPQVENNLGLSGVASLDAAGVQVIHNDLQ
jgi:hypothetical protein